MLFRSRFECFLICPLRRRRKPDDEHPHQCQKDVREKTDPDGATRSAIAVNFRENVAENLGDREKQLRTADTWNVTKEMNKWNDADFLTNQIRDQQDDHEDVHEQIVIPKAA